jgi:glucose/arabinose dehydrogenase
MIIKPFLVVFAFMVLIVNPDISGQYTLQNAFPNLSFDQALFLTHSGDGTNRIFVIERDGIVKVFPNSPSASNTKIFLDITDRVSTSGSEMGLLGLAFHPDYESNGYFYVNYTASNPRRTIVSRFEVTSNPDSADKDTEFEIISFSQPYENHNGGWIGFRPSDGYLYIAAGDGGDSGDPQNHAQRINTLLGKILRLDVDGSSPYAIPPTNPFYDSTNAEVKKEIYAWGFRNPWRCSFDPVTDLFFAGDVGQNQWEEIDVVEIGKNYGWRCYEGNHNYNLSGCNYPEYIDPVWEYDHGEGYSVTGGYVYRGSGVPSLVGKYIYADYGTRKVWSLEGLNPPTNDLLLTAPGSVTSFGVDENNELYITSFNDNIYRFTPTVVSVDDEITLTEYSLEQNYPNPFNPSTVIRYSLPEESKVKITIYDPLGRTVDTITNEVMNEGLHEKTWNAANLSSGIYYLKISAESVVSDKKFSNVIKMLYLK